MKTYLVLRFDEMSDDVVQRYFDLEKEGVDCCLFGSDSLETLKATHRNWLPNWL